MGHLWHYGWSIVCCAHDLDREGIGERHFPEAVEAARGTGVTGVEVGTKGNQFVIRAQAPQSRDPCRRHCAWRNWGAGARRTIP
jgi:hypothetical protein